MLFYKTVFNIVREPADFDYKSWFRIKFCESFWLFMLVADQLQSNAEQNNRVAIFTTFFENFRCFILVICLCSIGGGLLGDNMEISRNLLVCNDY